MNERIERCVNRLRSGADEQWCSYCDIQCLPQNICTFTEAADLIESLAAELEQVKRERDAAVEDLKKNSYTPCATCGKRIDNKSCTEFGERMPCDMINIFRCEMYEWRGVKKED